ncbi:MAG: HDOD domain-containing protein [Actinomycetota bacterium]
MIVQSGSDLRLRLERRIDELPVLPTVIGQLFSLDPDADGYFEQLLELVEADATFTARTLSAANAAASAPRHPIETVRAALARLGSDGVRSLVMAVAVTRVFIPRDEWEVSLWRHALQTASASRRLAAFAPEALVSPEVAYVIGLLHDIGRFVMVAEAPDSLRIIHEGTWDAPNELVDQERAICGLSHAEIGVMACRRWGLPAVIEDVIGRHHDPLLDPSSTFGNDAMLVLLRIADLLLFPSVLPGEPGWEEADLNTIEDQLMPLMPSWLTISSKQLQRVITGTVEETDRTITSLGFG